MRRLYILRFAVPVFAAAGLAGPLIRLVTWPPSSFEEVTSKATENFVYDLVLYLWPTQPVVGAYESTIGSGPAIILSVGENVVFFALLGLAVGAVAQWRAGLFLAFAGLCGIVAMIAMWGSGFSLAHVNWAPLLVSLVLYAIPVLLVRNALSKRQDETTPRVRGE